MEIDPPTFHESADTPTPPGLETTTASNSSLDFFPRKRPLHQDDPFFQEGTYEYKAAWLRLDDANAYIPDLTDPDDNIHRTAAQACHYGSCCGERTFSSAALYEYHFDTNHRHICQTCKLSFPGEKWLVLHIREIHDVLVRIQRERGDKTYQCFVEGCERLCSTPHKRRMHLIDKHQYPKHFNFSVVVTGVIPSAERTAHIQKQNAKEARKQGQKNKTAQQKQQQQHQQNKDYAMSDEHYTMEIEHSTTTTTKTTTTQASKNATANRRKSATPDPGSTAPAATTTASRTVKKNAFQQYRSQDSKSKPSLRKGSITHDHTDMDMDLPSTPVASGPSSTTSAGAASSQLDIDMDQLQLTATATEIIATPKSKGRPRKRPTNLQKWTAEADTLLADLRTVQGKKWLEIGQILDREPAVCMARFESTANPALKEFWTPERDLKLDQMVGYSKSWPEIAQELGVHRLACMERWKLLGSVGNGVEVGEKDEGDKTEAEIKAAKRKLARQEKAQAQQYKDRELAQLAKVRDRVANLRVVDQIDTDFDRQGWNSLLRDDQRVGHSRSWKKKSRLDAFSQQQQQQQQVYPMMNPGWSAKEETILIQFVLRHGLDQWGVVAKDRLRGRFSPEECRTCWKNLDMPVVSQLRARELLRQDHMDDKQGHSSEEKSDEGSLSDNATAAATPEPTPTAETRMETGTSKSNRVFVWDKEQSVRLQAVIQQAYKTKTIDAGDINWPWIARKVHPDATSRMCRSHWRFLHEDSKRAAGAVVVWKHEDVKRLEEGIRLLGPQELGAVREHFLPHMTKDDIMRHWFKISDKAATIDEEEYYRLMSAVKEVVVSATNEGTNDNDDDGCLTSDPQSVEEWNDVEDKMGGGWKRLPCKRVWESSFQHLVQHGKWTAVEDSTLLRMVKFVGRDDWYSVARAMQSGKSPWQCRLRWCQLVDPVDLDTSDLSVRGEKYC
ncbi:hypothetical protein BGX23_011276 [Mortierella sp. AD031]|nr:hypothetical protein BGX23_011276 [Mortierella sp. AD031]